MTQPPKEAPGERQVVVLRAGPPKSRGLVIDGIVGVLGVGLLVMAAVLGTTLPEEETPARQFKVEYLQDGHEALLCCAEEQAEPALSAREANSMPERTIKPYTLFVEHDNVYQFQVTLSVATGDDIPSSEPDDFTLRLLDLDGNEVPNGVLELTTPEPKRNPDQNSTQLFISEGIVSPPTSMRFAAKPGTEFVSVNDTSVTKAEVLREISAEKTLLTKGEWTIEVRLDAGDCPEPGTSPNSVLRASQCLQETDQSGEDRGNPYTISKVRYDFYTIQVTAPGEQSSTGTQPPA